MYPLVVDLRSSTKARNIVCRVTFHDTKVASLAELQGLESIYSRVTDVSKVTQAITAVSYHCKQPSFYEEVKLRLPDMLTESHHLIFTFYHVSCKIDDKKGDKEKIVGCAWLPLMKTHQIKTGMIDLFVAADLPKDYFTTNSNGDAHWMVPQFPNTSKVKWLDSKASLFSVSIKLASTLLSEDHYVQRFMSNAEKSLSTALDLPADLEQTLATGIRNLAAEQTSVVAIYNFMPTILNQLLFVIAARGHRDQQSSTLGKEAFDALCHVVEQAHANKKGSRCPDLAVYVKYSFHIYGSSCKAPSKPKGALHEELLYWINDALTYDETMQNTATDRAKKTHYTVLTHSWVFFELITRSLAMSIHLLGDPTKPRKDRVSIEFQNTVRRVVLEMASLIVRDIVAPLQRAKNLAASVVFFLRDLLTYIDRTFVFGVIQDFFKLLSVYDIPGPKLVVNTTVLAFMRLDALEILCTHEHYVSYSNVYMWHHICGFSLTLLLFCRLRLIYPTFTFSVTKL